MNNLTIAYTVLGLVYFFIFVPILGSQFVPRGDHQYIKDLGFGLAVHFYIAFLLTFVTVVWLAIGLVTLSVVK